MNSAWMMRLQLKPTLVAYFFVLYNNNYYSGMM